MTDVRTQIPEQYKWDLTAIYPDREAFEADYRRAEEMIRAFPAHEKTMAKSGAKLLAMLQDYTAIDAVIRRLYEYASRSSDVDLSNNEFLALEERVENLINVAGSASYFVSPALIRLEQSTLDRWMKSTPGLREYRRTLELERRRGPHMLSDEGEKLMADLQPALGGAQGTRSVFANADLTFGKIRGEDGKPVTLTEANYVTMLMSQDRRVRQAAFRQMYKVYGSFGNTLASLFNAFVKEQTTLAKVRRFSTSLEASTFRDEVTPAIMNNLIDTVNKNLSVLFRYYDLKKEVLGLGSLHMYDVYTPLIGSCDKKYTFEEAVQEVLDTVKVFGSEYHDTLEKGLRKDRWVDVFPNKGKRSGAYSAGCYDTSPLMLLNYTETLDDVSTLAHESGHSMHSWFSIHANTRQDSDYTIFVAEVASTVNELLFARKKLRESDSTEEKLSVLNQLMETYKGTLFRQTMFAEFERDMHALSEAGQPLTQEVLCDRYYEIVRRYFGPRVVCDKQISCEWMRIPHFYYNFYVYKYATCISAASAIVKKIEERGSEYVGHYLDFLRCGGSRSPLDSLLVAEVDLTRPEVIEDAIADFDAAVRQFTELYRQSR